jgi:hypothetical protein
MTKKAGIPILVCAFLLAGAIASSQTQKKEPLPAPKKETTSAWICRVLRVDPKTYVKLVGVRQGQEQIGGDHLALADLQAHTETQIDECGECWSPAVVDSQTVAFLKTDGVWVKPLRGGEAHLAVKAKSLRVLAGPAEGRTSAWVVLQHQAGGAGCDYRLVVADLASGQLDLETEPPKCLGEEDIGGVLRAGVLRGNKVLYNSPPGQGFRRILLGELTADGDSAGTERVPLLPWIEALADGIDRFDAVWVDDNRVVYAQKQ